MTRKNRYSNWREDLIEVMDIPSSEPKTDTEDEKKITEKKVKNKIVINPTMNEAFGEIGGTILEVVELDEVLDMKKADMGEVIKDFRKSDAPQFKGKSKEKRRQMAIAAKLTAERGGRKLGEGATEMPMSPQELSLQRKKTAIDMLIAKKRQQALQKQKEE